ncbi:MAG: type VI secretion system tube protein Hcp [Chitinophagaceae bacterium]|nr:type VI secretion system tube protein Hcp [Chitinophagaceae bacterium]
MKKILSSFPFIISVFISLQVSAQNVGIGTTTPVNRLSVAGKANITDSTGIGIAAPQALLDVRGGTLLRGVNNNTFSATPLRSAVEFFVGTTSGGATSSSQVTSDIAFNWGGTNGGFRHFMKTKHDIVPGNGNSMEFYINNSGTLSGSSAPGTGNDLRLAITGSGVGVGTNSPNQSAALDISSTNKGMLLPRVNDTIAITSPAEGLMIYNRNTKTPSFFDGAKWSSLSNAANTTNILNPEDSIMYRITGGQTFFTLTTQFAAVSVQDAGVSSVVIGPSVTVSNPNLIPLTFSKNFDINSIAFKRLLALKAANTGSIEFLVYKTGATTPYYSVKLTNWYMQDFQVTANTTNGKLLETINLTGLIIGYRDWVNNISFGYNNSTNTITTY